MSSNGDPTIKKRPLESPSQSAKQSKMQTENEIALEPDNKKVRMDHPQSPSGASSPPTKKRLIKVIPPKEPSTSPKAAASLSKVPSSSPSGSHKLNSTSAENKPSSPKKISSADSSAGLNGSCDATATTKPDKETNTVKDAAKAKEKTNSKEKILSKMQFDCDKSEVLRMIEEARNEGKPVVVTDYRLSNPNHPNFNLSLGHVVYTGAKSRSGYSNRASDLDLFLCPKFNPEHHFATIEVRIPSEFLSYRGNIAVRKSAVWGTDIYTDDSDVVAMIIHSGHYRPVDAPDPLPNEIPASTKNTSSIAKVISPILSQITPVVAQVDSRISSATTLVPDHDLHVTLRVLPRLIRYTGSTRYGLDSKGWGSLHDGESLQVVKVETVERNSVAKQVRKTFFKGASFGNERIFIFNSVDATCFKYTPEIMVDWPAYLHSGIKENVSEKESKKTEILKLPFQSDELKSMKDWPFWKVLLTRYRCVLYGKIKYYLSGDKEYVKIVDESERILFKNLSYDAVDFNDEDLIMSDLTDTGKNETYIAYAEKHGLYDLFHSTVSKLLIAKPVDPYQYLIDSFSKAQPSQSIILLAPPIANLKEMISSLAKQLDVVHIHSGNILEKAFQKQTSAGIQARAFVERGQLVPDYLIITMVLQQLKDPEVSERGFILDGFPRTKQQALALLQAGFIPDKVLDIEIPEQVVLQRALGLRFDPVTGESINIQDNVTRSPVVDARLIIKPSDTMESVKERLRNYHRHRSSIAECFKNSYRKFYSDSNLLAEIDKFLGEKPISKAPRSFRIILAGLPGSGKSTIAEKMAEKYKCVVVSPQKVIREAISAGRGAEFLPYLEHPYFAPSELIAGAIINRLKQRDCTENGWVLEGFPIKQQDMNLLKDTGITPNRVIWLSAPQSVCWTRLFYRRYDPDSSQVINLKSIPKHLRKQDLSRWIHAPKDDDNILEAKFSQYEATEKELKKTYGVRTNSNPTGIFHTIASNGVGENDENGINQSIETVFELIQGHLARPIPVTGK